MPCLEKVGTGESDYDTALLLGWDWGGCGVAGGFTDEEGRLWGGWVYFLELPRGHDQLEMVDVKMC